MKRRMRMGRKRRKKTTRRSQTRTATAIEKERLLAMAVLRGSQS
jgi:hypothetical protein